MDTAMAMRRRNIKNIFCDKKANVPKLGFMVQDCDFSSTYDSEADLSYDSYLCPHLVVNQYLFKQ